uniref:Serine/threonine-protein kinase PLK n=1 Tax=Syphacia muris TaxID=451379 RepID=A0A0N5ADM0_9BILA
MEKNHKSCEVPDLVINPKNRHNFVKGEFLGKGGFAQCYKLTDTVTRLTYAGKIISKNALQRKHQKAKMGMEINIHKSLSHPHIVRLEDFFEDDENVYILLELCSRRSLMELHRRRKAVTEPEARYFTSHVVSACEYLHARHIIHRDLKLGNLFLNDEMQVKVGDFGLATVLEKDGERKRTLCGTPNYIAPEMFGKRGHSYEVDIWAIGCILFTLLVGKPPFESSSIKETCQKIQHNDYVIPSRISTNASVLIKCLLAASPSHRPNIRQVASFDFFKKGFMPCRLPTTCLTVAPKFSAAQLDSSRNYKDGSFEKVSKTPLSKVKTKCCSPDVQLHMLSCLPESKALEAELRVGPIVTDQKCFESLDEAEDPAAAPVFWISKWVNYSNKYGLGYQLCDNSVGIIFNDNTKLVLDAAGKQVQYTERDNSEQYFTLPSYPVELRKKIKLLNYFRNYMSNCLRGTGANISSKEGDELARLPYLRMWFQTNAAIVFYMSNGVVQMNFFSDHKKLIVCPLMKAATCIDSRKRFRTFRIDRLIKYGCSNDLL